MSKGLYANIHAKRKRIKAGSKEKMRKVGSRGAPTANAFKRARKTARKRTQMNGLLSNNFDYGNRPDGTAKGTGFFGLLNRPDGTDSTELSIGVEMDGKETLIPAIVPTLTQDELNTVLTSGVTPQIVRKAADYARERISNGLNPFWQQGEKTYFGEYQYQERINGYYKLRRIKNGYRGFLKPR